MQINNYSPAAQKTHATVQNTSTRIMHTGARTAEPMMMMMMMFGSRLFVERDYREIHPEDMTSSARSRGVPVHR